MKKFVFILLFFPAYVCAQTIAVIAGDGFGAGGPVCSGGYTGDGGPAVDAELNLPARVALDIYGNLYIADQCNNVVRKVNTAGIVSTVAGTGGYGYSGDNGPATAAAFRWIADVAIDNSGNLYIADNGNNVVRKVDTSGIITTVAGNGYGAGVDTSGILSGGYSGDGGPATNAELFAPTGVAADAFGNLFIIDQIFTGVIRKVNPAGIISTIAGTDTVGYSGDGGPATHAQLAQPSGVSADLYGNLFIADNYNNVIRKINNAGIISTVAGNGYGAGSGISGFFFGGNTGDSGPAVEAELYSPSDVSVDRQGNLFIADQDNSAIRKVDSAGIITTIAGGHMLTPLAVLRLPSGVKVDPEGNLFIADGANYVVWKLSPPDDGVPQLTADNGGFAISPNPASNSITISSNHTIYQMTISNLAGQTFLSGQYLATIIKIDISALPPGVYLAKLNGIEVSKFVKE